MAVRVRLQLRGMKGECIESVALLNGGFETDEPCILLPSRLASILFSTFPEGAVAITGKTVAGSAVLLRIPSRVQARVLTSDRRGRRRQYQVLVSDAEDECLVSDMAIDALGVRIESFRTGTWRFANEKRRRASEPPQYWA